MHCFSIINFIDVQVTFFICIGHWEIFTITTLNITSVEIRFSFINEQLATHLHWCVQVKSIILDCNCDLRSITVNHNRHSSNIIQGRARPCGQRIARALLQI